MRFRSLVLPVALVLAVSTFGFGKSHATTIDVQFSGNFSFNCGNGTTSCSNPAQTGAAFVGSAGDRWNDFNVASATTTLLNTSGAASGVSIQFSSDGSASPYTDGTYKNNFASTPYANLFGGYLSSTNANGISITLSGLLSGQSYDLYTYSEQDGPGNAGRSMAVTANGVTQVDTQSGAGSFIRGDTYLAFSGTADASGNLSIGISTLSGESDLNGFQLVTAAAVPEPSTAALLAVSLGTIGLIVRRRSALR